MSLNPAGSAGLKVRVKGCGVILKSGSLHRRDDIAAVNLCASGGRDVFGR